MSASRLRIGVDGRAFSSPAGGVRRYVSELYAAMSRGDGVEIVAIGAQPDASLPRGVIPIAAHSLPTNLGWMALSLPLAVRRARVDVFHAPDYKAPLWGVHPQAVTIHDVSYERVPEWDAYRNDPARRYFYRRGALAADRVITDSQFSRSEIAAAYGIGVDRIDVVPLAAAPTLTPGVLDAAQLPAGVRQPYCLHVGDIQIRRNLATALDAVIGVRAEFRLKTEVTEIDPAFRLKAEVAHPELMTFICAGVDRGIAASLRQRAEGAGDPGAILFTGSVSDEVLVNLYRGAAMLLYPSRYEGFGLPVLEAMQCGVPVIAANAASIPEVLGDAGSLLDPLDVSAWRAEIARLLVQPDAAAAMRARGVRRAATFSWGRTADATLDVLRRCAAEARA